jgi:hypothetical protein
MSPLTIGFVDRAVCHSTNAATVTVVTDRTTPPRTTERAADRTLAGHGTLNPHPPIDADGGAR